MPSSFCFGEERLLFTHHLNPSLAELISSFSYHASSPTLPLKLETEYREDPSLKAMVTQPPWTEPQVISPLSQHPLYPLWSRLWTSHRMLATDFISPLSQHPLYPLWSRLWTSPQNVAHLNPHRKLETDFKYPQITGLPHGLGGDLLLLVCLEPGAQQPCGLHFLNRLLHTRTFPLLHTMVKSSACGEQRTLLVNLKHHSNSSKDKTQEYWDQSLINHQV
ncbi:hypothetical protein YC2023_116744 [Brassica napus]